MSKYYFTTTDLINSVKRRISSPDSQSMISDEEILEFANEEMELNLVPLIISKHEDYFLYREDISIVPTQKEYAIPYRAIGSKLRELAYSSDRNQFTEMSRISIDDATYSGVPSNSYGAVPGHFYIKNENVVIHTQGDLSSGYLVFFYALRPNSFVLSEKVGVITSIDRSSGIISLTSIPEEFSMSYQYDFIQARSPHKLYKFDIDTLSIDAGVNTMTFNPSDIPEQLRVGDRITVAGETDVINCPSELHVYLAQCVGARILESIGDLEAVQLANQKIDKMERNASALLDNRVDGSPIKIRRRNGLLSGGRRGGRF